MRNADTLLARYRPLFDIAVEHRYFADGRCRGLEWQLQPGAAKAVQLTLCAWRATVQGVAVYVDVSRTQALHAVLADAAPSGAFGLTLRAVDPLFRHYTTGLGSNVPARFAFDSVRTTPEDDGSLRLHAGECIAESDRAAPADDATSDTADAGARRQVLGLAPRIDIRIGIDDDTLAAATASSPAADASGTRYRLRFAARETYWQYNVLGAFDGSGDWSPEHAGIVDLAERIGFEPNGARRLANGRTAHTFRSKTAIPLQERSPQRFQLRVQDQGAERVVVKRLPVASAGQFSIEEHAGAPRWVSEIYVHC